MAKKRKLPPKPVFGSIEKNKVIRAVNDMKPNPLPDLPEAVRFYESVMKNRKEMEAAHPGIPCIFDLVEPDEYEDAMMDGIMPDGWYEQMLKDCNITPKGNRQ